MTDPTRIARVEARHERLPREDLLRGVDATELDLRGARVAVGGVPLFRERHGVLEQAVRVAVAAESGHGVVSVTLRDAGGAVLDHLELPATGLATSNGTVAEPVHADAARGLLFVPAPDAPKTFGLELASAGGLTHVSEVTIAPQRRWEISLIHQSHLDIGYTDPQPLVLAHHLDYLDAALDHVGATDDWPDAARFRWNVEANLPLTQWLATRPRGEREAMLARIAEGRIEVCALPYTMHSEAYSLDELARMLVPAQGLRERHGIEIVTAMQTDVPGCTIGLAELLASAGVKYLSVAHNYAGRSTPHLTGGQELARPFWWRAPSGKRLLVWHTDSPHGVAYMEGNIVGLAEGYEQALALLPEYLLALGTRPYPYSAGTTGWLTGIAAGTRLTRAPHGHDLLHLRVQSAFADNASPGLVPASIAREWNDTWAWPRLRSATNREFFETAEARVGDEIPTYDGDWTDWWADGIGSAARELGRGRRAQAGARTAQTLHAFADALDAVGPDRTVEEGWRAELDAAYEDMALFDEHTWGASNPWNDALEEVDAGALQWGWKSARAHSADERVGRLLDGARARLAARVPAPADAHAGVLVVNTSASARTDVVELLLLESRVPITRELAVVDLASGERMPAQLAPQPHADHRPRGQRLRFLARDVPAYGFARFAIVADAAGGIAAPDAADPARLESERFAADVDVATGTLTSLVEQGRQLLNTASAFAFNQYVYDRYATAPLLNHLSSRVGGLGEPWMLGSRELAGDGVVVARTSSALEETVTIRLRAPGARSLTTTYRLVHGADRLDVENVLDKVSTPDKESVFFAFPLAGGDHARFACEITGGVHADGDPVVPGSAEHMRAIRNWVAVHGPDAPGGAIAWATREAPLVQLGNIHLPYAPFPTTIAPDAAGAGTVFSWAMNNGWDTNFPAQQGGETTFAYAVLGGGAADFDALRTLGARAAAGVAQPLTGIVGSPRAQGDLPERGRLAEIDDPRVELLALGPDPLGGDGLVAQLHSHARERVSAAVSFPDLPASADGVGDFLARSVERAGDRVDLAPGELRTVTLDLDRRSNR